MRQDEKTKIMPTPKKEDIEKRLGRASAMNTARKGDGGFVPARQARTENKAPEVRRKEGALAEEPQPLREEVKKETRREKNKHLPSWDASTGTPNMIRLLTHSASAGMFFCVFFSPCR